MRVVFTIDADGYASMTPGSKKALDDCPPVVAADFARDILCDAFDAYNAARIRCGFSPIKDFHR